MSFDEPELSDWNRIFMSIAVQRACGALRFDAMRRAVMSYGRVAQKKILIVALVSFFMSQEFVAVCEATLCVSSVAAGSIDG